MDRHWLLPLVALALVLSAGCASGGSRSVRLAEATPAMGWAVVEDVPEIRQSSSDSCGAAALAMVLGRWGRRVTEGDIVGASPPLPGKGIRADRLRDFARGEGFEAFLFEGDVADLDREIARNRPVLVGVVKRRGRRAYSHYEVVVGVNREMEQILTLDPARGPRESSVERFTQEWAAAGRLTLVVFPRVTDSAAAASAGR